MAASIIVEAFPWTKEVSPITTPEDVIWLAYELLKNDNVVAVLKRVGEHGDFADEEEQLVDEAMIVAGERFKVPGQSWDNLSIAVALARKLICGSIEMGDAEACRVFAEDKIRTSPTNQVHSIGSKPLRMSEIIQFLRNLKARPDILDPFINTLRMPEGKDRDEAWDKIQNSVYIYCVVQGWKYGLANRYSSSSNSLNSVVIKYAVGRLPSLDEAVVLAELREWHAGFSGVQYILDDLAA